MCLSPRRRRVRFLARAGRENAERTERAAAAGLATELGYLPLALEQAAAYIAEIGATFISHHFLA